MRRLLQVTCVPGVLLLLTAGLSIAQDSKKEKQEPKAAKTPNYYPIDLGNTWHYRVTANGTDTKFITRISKIDNINGDVLARLDSPNATITEHLKQVEKGVFRARFNGAEVTPPVLLMPYPAKIGAKWNGEFTVGTEPAKHTYTGEIQKEETIEVPAGKFKTIRVYIKLQENGKQVETTYWFARDVGFVKQTGDVLGVSVLLELEKFERKK